MKKHEHPTNRLEKMSNFFGGGNFSKLNLYTNRIAAVTTAGRRKILSRGFSAGMGEPPDNP